MILEGLLEKGQLHCKVYGKMDMEKSGSKTSGLIDMHSLYWYQNNTLHSTCIELWEVDFTAVLILFLSPSPLLDNPFFFFLHFQTDKLIFGCVDVNFGPSVTSTSR